METVKKTIIIASMGVLLAAATGPFLLDFFQKAHNFYEFSIGNGKEEHNDVQILFVGDLMFDRGIRFYADNSAKTGGGGNNFIFDKINDFLVGFDLVAANLEGPITAEKSKSLGTKPGSFNNYFFTFDPSLAKTLFNNNIRILSLGNNHILNFGRQGIASTQNYLDQVKIGYFGAPEGNKSKIIEINGLKLGFVGYNEFFGNLQAEQQSTLQEIEKLREQADIIIVFCHWGSEYRLSAGLEQKKIGHHFVDAGADLVIGSHPHVIEPVEEYKGPDGQSKRIYYSLGNFIFDQHFNEDVRKGLGVIVTIDKKTKSMTFQEQGFYLDKNGQTILRQIIEKTPQI